MRDGIAQAEEEMRNAEEDGARDGRLGLNQRWYAYNGECYKAYIRGYERGEKVRKEEAPDAKPR